MPPLIENPADCEIRFVIRYLSAKGVKAVEIHCNICEVYGKKHNEPQNGTQWHLKNHHGGQRHDDDDMVKTTVLQWLSHQSANFHDDGIKHLVVRYDKCLNIGGNYVEKQIKAWACK